MKKLLLFLSLFSFSIAQAQTLTDTGQIRTYVNANIVTNGTKAITAVTLNKILNGYLNAWPSSGINTINTTGPLSWNAVTKTLSLTGYNAANWNTVYNWYVAGGGGGSSVTGTKSINISSGVAQLQNDILSPGPGKVYGTDASGIRGWYLPPAPSLSGTKSINYSAGIIQLVNDATSPGNTKIYGTDASGIKGWYDAPTGGGGTPTVQNFQTVSSLKSSTFNTTSGSLVANVFDLGGASYKWNPTSTSSDDAGITTIAVTGVSTGRWEKIFKGRVRVTEAGVKSDGTNQATALQAILSNSSVNEILIDQNITVSSGIINGGNKTFVIQNGAKISGGATFRNFHIEASDVQQIFDTTAKVIGLQRASVAWWGARRDNSNPRLTRRAFQLGNDAVSTGGLLVVPADSVLGSSVYWLDSTLTLKNDITIRGEGSILNPQTKLFWPTNTVCINIDGTGAKRLTLSSLWLQQAIPVTFDSSKHAIVSNTFVNLDNIYFYNIAGDGIHIVANPPFTNADHSKIHDCYFNNCNNGIFLDGSDVNILDIAHNDFTLNRHWGYYSNGFLGNYLANNHFAENGKQNDVFVSYAGHTYFAINLIGVSNLNHKPDVSPTYWEQAVYDLSYPAWDSTKYYNSGGPYAAVNPNARERNLDSYLEAYQPRPIMPPSGFRDGGLHEEGGPKNGGNLDVVNSTILLGYDVAMKHNLQVNNTTQALRYEVLQFNSGYFFPKPEGIQGMTGQDGNLGFYQQGGIQFYLDSSTNRLMLNNQPVSPTDSTKTAATTAQVMRAINARGGGGGGSSYWSQTGNNLINNNTGTGGAIVSSSLFLNVDAYPSSVSNAYYISSGLSSAISARHIFGDGSGWKMVYAKRTGGTTTDLFTMQDNGNFDAVGSISSPLVLPNKLAVNSGTTSPTETAVFGLGNNNDIAIGTAAGNKYFHTGYADYGITAMNRRPSDGVYSNSSLGAVEYRMHSTGSGGTFEVGNYPAGSTAYTQRFFIDEAGNVGINNNSPSTMFDVAGMIRSGTGGYKFPDGTVQTTAATTLTMASGTYTPTLTNNANISASTSYTCHYMRVGNEVTVSGKVGITPTAGSTTTQLILNLPVTTANFTAQEQAGGTGYFQNGAVNGTAKIQANPSNQTVSLIFYSNGTGVADFSFTFQYTIQ